MKKLLLSIVLIFSIIYIQNCTSDNSTDTNDNGDNKGAIWPLAIGNEWIYECKRYDDGELTYSGLDTIVIDTSVQYNNSIYYKLFGWWCINKNDGLRHLFIGSEDKIEEEVLFHYYLPIGEVWDVHQIDNIKTLFIKSKSTYKETQAGNFLCYQYEGHEQHPIKHYTTNIYISDGVGLVYFEVSEDFNSGKNETGTSELISFNLK